MKIQNAEIVMTTLNGLPRSWDSYIQGICARKKLVKFSRLWEECSQEEAREENMGSEYQLLRYTPSQARENLMVLEVSTFTKIIEIYLGSYAIIVMKQDTMQGIFLTNRR